MLCCVVLYCIVCVCGPTQPGWALWRCRDPSSTPVSMNTIAIIGISMLVILIIMHLLHTLLWIRVWSFVSLCLLFKLLCFYDYYCCYHYYDFRCYNCHHKRNKTKNKDKWVYMHILYDCYYYYTQIDMYSIAVLISSIYYEFNTLWTRRQRKDYARNRRIMRATLRAITLMQASLASASLPSWACVRARVCVCVVCVCVWLCVYVCVCVMREI